MRNVKRMYPTRKSSTIEGDEGGEEDHMLQLSETWTHHGRLFRFQEQDIFLHEAKEAVCKEGVQSHLGLGK